MKKVLSFLVCFSIILSTMILGVSSAVAYAAKYEPSPESDFIAFDGIIEEYVGPGGDVVIPAEIDGEPTIEIAARAFFGNTDVSSVIIPEGVEKIGNSAFEGCTNIYKIELPYSLYYLGATVFRNCQGLEAVTIPGGVVKVPYGTFSGATALSDIKFSNGVKEIHQFAFSGTSPKKLVFPESLDFICGASFNYLNTKENVEIVICNPNLDLGRNPKAGALFQDQLNGAFTDEIFRPWNSSITPNMVFRIFVPEGSDIAAFVKDWKNNGLLEVGKEDGARNNSYVVREEDEAYYKQIEAEIATYSIEKTRADLDFSSPSAGNTDNGNNTGSDNQNNSSTGGNNNNNNGNGASNNNNNSSGQTVFEEQTDNSTLWIVLAVVAVVFVLLVVGVGLFAFFVLKKKPASAPKAELTLEELQEQMNRLMQQQEAEAAEETEE